MAAVFETDGIFSQNNPVRMRGSRGCTSADDDTVETLFWFFPSHLFLFFSSVQHVYYRKIPDGDRGENCGENCVKYVSRGDLTSATYGPKVRKCDEILSVFWK